MSSIIKSLSDVARAIAGLDLPDDVHICTTVDHYPTLDPTLHIDIHCRTVDQVRTVRRAVGHVDKTQTTAGMVLYGRSGDATIRIWPPRDVCQQVQVGIERKAVLAETGEYEDVPVFEWDCGPVLTDEQVPA